MFNIKNLRKAKAEVYEWQKQWKDCFSVLERVTEENIAYKEQIKQLKSQLPNRDTKNGRFTSKKK